MKKQLYFLIYENLSMHTISDYPQKKKFTQATYTT